MATKTEIIKSIIELSNDNPNIMNSILGKGIVDACKESIDAEINIDHIEKIIESSAYLIDQIKMCNVNDPDELRIRNKYIESLKKCIEKLC